MDISSWFKWIPPEIPMAFQWIGVLATLGAIILLLIRYICGKPKFKVRLGSNEDYSYLKVRIWNPPIKVELLRLLGVTRDIKRFNVIYYVGKKNNQSIIYSGKLEEKFIEFPSSDYEIIEFNIKPVQYDEWLKPESKRPLDDGDYTIKFEIVHDNKVTIRLKEFVVKTINNKAIMTSIDEVEGWIQNEL